MPVVRPFRGIRYADSIPLVDVVCPPYDVITPEQQAALHRRHAYNAIRLELPKDVGVDKYAGAAACFDDWLVDGVVRQDDTEALYAYRQEFSGAEGEPRRVVGIIGALELEDFGRAAGVLPHERTMPGPLADRLALLRACPINVSPIYAIYRGAGALSELLGSSIGSSGRRAIGLDGITHSLWRITDDSAVELAARVLAERPLVIADGHHRYETALAYHREKEREPGRHDAIMCYCVDADSEPVMVLPYHRVLRARTSSEELKQILVDDYSARPIDAGDASEALASSAADHSFVFVLPRETYLVEVGDERVVERLGRRPRGWRTLDVVALHEALLPSLFPDGIEDAAFSSDSNEVVKRVRDDGWTAGILMRAVAPPQVVEVARTNERMPQKASYFWPKALTGLVFRSL